MKIIVAYLPTDSFDSARVALSDLGVSRMTIFQVHTADRQSSITLHQRRAILETHLRPELRLECAAADGQSRAIVDALRGPAGSATQVSVFDLEELHHESSREHVFPGDPRLDLPVG